MANCKAKGQQSPSDFRKEKLHTCFCQSFREFFFTVILAHSVLTISLRHGHLSPPITDEKTKAQETRTFHRSLRQRKP